MTQHEIDRLVNEWLKNQDLRKLGLAGYMQLKTMLEEGRVIGPRADGHFLWRARQQIISRMGDAPAGQRFAGLLNPLTDVQGKKLAEDYEKKNGVPVEMLFLKGMILSYHIGVLDKNMYGRSAVTIEDIPQFSLGLVQRAVNPTAYKPVDWFETNFGFVQIPTGWSRRKKVK